MFSTLRAGYNSLQSTARPTSAEDTIEKLCERLLNGTQREDRKAALLGLKGLSRDWKSEVGARALPILLGVLEDDAAEDTEMAKAVVETLSLLCEVEEQDGRPVRDDSGLRNTDVFLATPTALHTLLKLLTPSHFYLRFFSLQLLGILLANRPQQVQQYVLTAAGGIGRLVEMLDDAREIIRNESLLLIIALTTQNADIQKLLAFEGAFDKLFGIVRSGGGIGAGGIIVQDCLAAVGGLLRWNVSNQNYFRETSCIPLLAPLLLFPRPNALNAQSLATFAFQSWSEQKVINAGLVISLVRMLVGGAGGSGRSQNQDALLKTGLTRCLIELALASNAPAVLKSQSLNALADIMRSSADNQTLLTTLIVTPLIPPAGPSSPETYTDATSQHDGQLHSSVDGQSQHRDHDEAGQRAASKWRRGTSVPAVVAVTDLAVHGDGTPGREGLRVRAAAANLFTSYAAGSTENQLGILSTMIAPPPEEASFSPGSIILTALRTFPTPTRNESFDSYVPFFACLLFSHLVMHSEVCKEVARKIYFQGDEPTPGGMGDEDDRTTLVGMLVGNLMMAQREQAQSANAGLGPERGLEWSRVMVGYLTSLSLWMWESPLTVKEFLSEGSNLQVLIQPITQSSGVDSVIQGLCTFLLGICYEYNCEPGPISRETLHPILHSRVGPDQFVSRILRLREDPRFRNVGPNVLELVDEDDTIAEDLGEEDGLWFDFSFVEFLKTNYIRSMDGVSPEVLAALRASLAAQTKELDDLRDALQSLAQERDQERNAVEAEFASLSDTIVSLRSQLEEMRQVKEEADREQEDLLVLLEELSEKRRRDKKRMRKAGLDVSEDEDGGDGEDDASSVEEEAPPEHVAPRLESPTPAIPPVQPAALYDNASPVSSAVVEPQPAPSAGAQDAEPAAPMATLSDASTRTALADHQDPVPDVPAASESVDGIFSAAPEALRAATEEPIEAKHREVGQKHVEQKEIERKDGTMQPSEAVPNGGADAVKAEDASESQPELAAPSSPPTSAPPPPKTSASSAKARDRESTSRMMFEPELDDEICARSRTSTPAPPPPKASAAPPLPRSSAFPSPRTRRALQSSTSSASSKPVAPLYQPFRPATPPPTTDQDKPRSPSVALPPPAPSASAPEPASEPSPPTGTSQPPVADVAEQPDNAANPDPKIDEPAVIPAEEVAPEPEAPRRTSVDDRLAAAFGAFGPPASFDPSPSPFHEPAAPPKQHDNSSLFGGSSSTPNDIASIFGLSPSPPPRAKPEPAATVQEAPPPEQRSSPPPRDVASLFGGMAATAASLFGGNHAPSSRDSNPLSFDRSSAVSPLASRPDASSLFGSTNGPASVPRQDTSSPFARQDAPLPFARQAAASPFGRQDAASPFQHADRLDGPAFNYGAAQRKAEVRDVSSLFG
ncbi:transporter [Rhodotorula toruloides]|uniref:Transporter n=1 Tax=Rhodotorula toruloides TaxID=5286 RepID=A0A511K7X0_RHOTO|nr:transporter [Rhodotorula toruloides]